MNGVQRGALARYADGGFAAREKMKNEPYYDPALAMRVSKLLGPGFQSAFAPKRKRFLKTDFPLNLHGMYVRPGTENEEPMVYPYAIDSRGEVMHDLLAKEPDTVYAFGEKPSAKTLAHEYRHRAGILNEQENRLYDALYAETDEDWREAVHFWRDQLVRSRDFYGDRTEPPTEEEAEKDLVETLDRSKIRLREREWDMAPEDQKPQHSDPTFGGWLRHILSSDRSEYSWNAPPAYYEKKARGGLIALTR